MKIATFNINNINKRLANLLVWLRTAKPDVVCLQELKSTNEAFPKEAIEKAGYSAIFRGQKSWNGVAILGGLGEPVVTRAALPGDPADTQSRYIEAAVNGVLIGTLYAPNGNCYSHRCSSPKSTPLRFSRILRLLQQRLAIERSIFVQYFPGRVAARIGWHYVIKDLSQNPKCWEHPDKHDSVESRHVALPPIAVLPTVVEGSIPRAHDIYEKEPDHDDDQSQSYIHGPPPRISRSDCSIPQAQVDRSVTGFIRTVRF